jgi:2-oxoglutarate ferredoxin oxidoreductase subunit gamma
MTERELLLTGIGGQGVQLAAQVIARAATIEGRNVALFGVYGGMMRGGNTDATVVVGDGPLQAPPLISHSWSAIAMHDEFWEPLESKLRPDGVVLVNDATFGHDITAPVNIVRLQATELAAEIGNPQAGTMVMVGAYSALTRLVGLDALIEGMRESIPSYRSQHIEANERALRAGHDAVTPGLYPAWEEVAV